MQHGPALHMGSMAKKRAAYETALKGKRQIAEGTYEFTFEKPEGFQFVAGQHVRMSLINPPETDAEGDKRFFTIASTPSDENLIFAMRMRDTAFKRTLASLQVGDKVQIEILLGEAPRGSFVLHEDESVPAVFIVGGIGIVPALAIIKDATQRKLSHRISLFYANRRPEDAPYLPELKKLTAQNPSFNLIATMTHPEKSATTWHGETGAIDRAMLEKYSDHVQESIIYVAGLPEMVAAMQTMLSDLSVDKGHIRAEEFAGFKMGQADESPQPKKRSHLVLGVIAVAILAMIAVHVAGAVSIALGGAGILSFSNPYAYLMLGLLLFLVLFKYKHKSRLKHAHKNKRNNSQT